MQVFESAPEDYLNAIFGDAQTVLDTCGSVLINGEITPLSDDKYEMYHEIHRLFAQHQSPGLRCRLSLL